MFFPCAGQSLVRGRRLAAFSLHVVLTTSALPQSVTLRRSMRVVCPRQNSRHLRVAHAITLSGEYRPRAVQARCRDENIPRVAEVDSLARAAVTHAHAAARLFSRTGTRRGAGPSSQRPTNMATKCRAEAAHQHGDEVALQRAAALGDTVQATSQAICIEGVASSRFMRLRWSRWRKALRCGSCGCALRCPYRCALP